MVAVSHCDCTEKTLDHIGHFVLDTETARESLIDYGFSPTPFSTQYTIDEAGNYTPTGTGNICAMLQGGYIEILGKTHDTPLGRELTRAVSVFEGLHLLAFSSSDARVEPARLQRFGFPTRPLVELNRPAATETGEEVAKFTVARVLPGTMPEGRIQFLTHHTSDLVWQKRWLSHLNGAQTLNAATIATNDIKSTSERYARFLDASVKRIGNGAEIELDRGRIIFVSPASLECIFSSLPKQESFLAAYLILVQSLDRTRLFFRERNIAMRDSVSCLAVRFPKALGKGGWFFVEDECFDLTQVVQC